jgi:hypothetical protein
LAATYTELEGAPPRTVKGVVPAVRSSIANRSAPPDPASFARSCQFVVGKPAAVLVSSKRRRTTDCFRRSASPANVSLFVQASPMQALPSTIRSSGTS